MATNAQIAQYVEGSVEVLMGIIFGIWGLWAGGLISDFMGRLASPKQRQHRNVLYTMALGSVVMGLFVFIMAEGGLTFTRTVDGVLAEYSRQIGYLIGVSMFVYALSVYGMFTHGAWVHVTLLMALTYTCTLIATFFGYSVDLRWVLFSFWAFFLVVGMYCSWAAMAIKVTPFYANYVAWAVLYVFVALQGIWLIISPMVTNSVSNDIQNYLYAAFAALVPVIVGIIIAATFYWTEPLYASGNKSRNGYIGKKMNGPPIRVGGGIQNRYNAYG
jgi:hypothetical protein